MYEIIFQALADCKVSDYNNKVLSSLASLFPKDSNSLSRLLMKNVLEPGDLLLIVITGHLYMDYILGLCIARKGENSCLKKYQSFSGRLMKANELGYFQLNEYIFLKEINRLRNKLAHDIFYDIYKWDLSVLPYVSQNQIKVPKVKKYRLELIKVVIKLGCLVTFWQLGSRNRWLRLEDRPQN